MKDTNSMLPGARRDFPTTIWSRILQAADPSSPAYREELERLCRLYWKPVYCYIRSAWKKRSEEAIDLTQAFFARILDTGLLSRAREDRGSFRGYLKRSLRNFLIDAERHDAVRRPPGPVYSLEASPDDFETLGPARPDEPPEEAYDRAWFRCVMDRAIEALRAELESSGRGLYFEVFRLYLPGGEDVTYESIAGRFGLELFNVRNYLHYCRKVLRRILREKIGEYVSDPREIESELADMERA